MDTIADKSEPNLPGSRSQRRWNYWMHAAEGSIYFAGLAFVQAELVIPSMFRSLGASNLLISLAPMLMMIGFLLPPLFTAHLVERMRRLKPTLVLAIALHRTPFVAIAFALYFYGKEHPTIVLWTTVISLFLAGTFFGAVMTAWMEYVVRTIGTRRISSCMAIRNFMGAAMGVAAGGLIKTILDTYPSHQGYSILFLIAIGFSVVSLVFFALIKEPEEAAAPVSENPSPGFLALLRSAPGLLGENRQVLNMLICYIAFSGIFVVAPFMGIHAVDTTQRGDSFLGDLVMWQMGGSLLGNIIAGFWGDRYGPKLPMMVARFTLVAFLAGLLVAQDPFHFKLLFALFGLGYFMNMSTRLALSLEVCSEQRRPTYMAILTFMNLISLTVAALASALIRNIAGSLQPALLVSLACMAVSIFYLARIKNTRAEAHA